MSRRMNSRRLQNVFLMVVMGVRFTSCWNSKLRFYYYFFFLFSLRYATTLCKCTYMFLSGAFTPAGSCSWLMKCAASLVCMVMTWGVVVEDYVGLCLPSIALVLLHFTELQCVIKKLFFPSKMPLKRKCIRISLAFEFFCTGYTGSFFFVVTMSLPS